MFLYGLYGSARGIWKYQNTVFMHILILYAFFWIREFWLTSNFIRRICLTEIHIRIDQQERPYIATRAVRNRPVLRALGPGGRSAAGARKTGRVLTARVAIYGRSCWSFRMCISVKKIQRIKFDVSQKPLIQKMHTEPEYAWKLYFGTFLCLER